MSAFLFFVRVILPPVILDHMRQFDDIFALRVTRYSLDRGKLVLKRNVPLCTSARSQMHVPETNEDKIRLVMVIDIETFRKNGTAQADYCSCPTVPASVSPCRYRVITFQHHRLGNKSHW